MTPKRLSIGRQQLVDCLRYWGGNEMLAEHIKRIMTGAADEIEALTEEVEQLRAGRAALAGEG